MKKPTMLDKLMAHKAVSNLFKTRTKNMGWLYDWWAQKRADTGRTWHPSNRSTIEALAELCAANERVDPQILDEALCGLLVASAATRTQNSMIDAIELAKNCKTVDEVRSAIAVRKRLLEDERKKPFRLDSIMMQRFAIEALRTFVQTLKPTKRYNVTASSIHRISATDVLDVLDEHATHRKITDMASALALKIKGLGVVSAFIVMPLPGSFEHVHRIIDPQTNACVMLTVVFDVVSGRWLMDMSAQVG